MTYITEHGSCHGLLLYQVSLKSYPNIGNTEQTRNTNKGSKIWPQIIVSVTINIGNSQQCSGETLTML